ncbi:MAG: ATP-binding cassette domain-containing protein [Nitrospiraceae bacterium]|nr:ATP-binding cassette domain-containing protein [Nitrospiraceae bacterium]
MFFGILKFAMALMLPASLGLVTKFAIEGEFSGVARTVQLPVIGTIDVSQGMFQLLGMLFLLTLALLARTPVTFLRSYLAAKAGHSTILDLRRDLFKHIQRLSLAYHHKRRAGNITARLIADLNAAQGILNRGVIAVAMDLSILAGVIVLLFALDWRLAAVSLSTLPFYGIAFYYINPRLRIAATAVQQEIEEMSGEVTEKIGGLQVVKSFVREASEEASFLRRLQRYYVKVLHRVRLRVTLTSLAEFLQAFGPLTVIAYGGYRCLQDPRFLPQLIWFYGFIQHLYLPARRLADCSAIIQEKLAAVDRVFEVLDSQPDIQDSPSAVPLPAVQGNLRFDDVSFGYHDATLVLDGISFEIEPGQALAIVGRSGAGKTTLVNLVPRFYDITGGAITVDGHDIREVTIHSLRENIGMVLQDTILFSGTIRENILYGRPSATCAEMKEAARMAHVDEFVDDLPDGYDTIIGERGVTLSGGQKQRISIARAFLCDPRILILDEATSSLDSRAETIIQDALRELMRGRTTLVIAHRLSTIVDCDLVIAIDQGRVVEQGPHDVLIGKGGLYRQLCEEQFGRVHIEEFVAEDSR